MGFSNIHSVAKQQKILKGGPFEEKNFRKKSLAVPKKIGRGDPLVSPGMVCYAGKQEKPFWFSSLDQIVQFGAIIFCRTILVSSCGLKKIVYISRVPLHEAPTKNRAVLSWYPFRAQKALRFSGMLASPY